jgi:hypothetical protein
MDVYSGLVWLVVVCVAATFSSYLGQRLASWQSMRQFDRIIMRQRAEIASASASMQELAVIGHDGLMRVMNLLMRYNTIPADDLLATAHALRQQNVAARARYEALQRALAEQSA